MLKWQFDLGTAVAYHGHMNRPAIRCLILGCGNTLRGDDGVGPALCGWAEQRFAGEAGVRIVARQQWTPELAWEISAAESVIFIDCSLVSEPGVIVIQPVVPSQAEDNRATHEISAPELLALAKVLFGRSPLHAELLTIGAGSTEMGVIFSTAVQASVQAAQRALEGAVRRALEASSDSTQR